MTRTLLTLIHFQSKQQKICGMSLLSIAHNGLGLCAVWDFKAQKFSLAQMFNRNPNVQFSTSAQIAQNPCYGQLLFGVSNL
jgi:hypothetical protein